MSTIVITKALVSLLALRSSSRISRFPLLVSSMAETTDSKEQKVDPWTARAAEGSNTIDYDKLIGMYNVQ